MNINDMLRRDSVKNRIEGEDGMSLTEFSYQALQARLSFKIALIYVDFRPTISSSYTRHTIAVCR